MEWYRLSGAHIQHYQTTLKYLETEEGIGERIRLVEFSEKFLRPYYGRSGIEPAFNPVKDLAFLLNKKPKDLYIDLGILTRHLIISPRLATILAEMNLPSHIIFDEVLMVNKETQRQDYKYLHLIESMWDKVDLAKTVFRLEDINDPNNVEYVHFNSEEYAYYFNTSHKITGKRVDYSVIVIPGIEDYDLFPLFNISESECFISEKLAKRLKKDKILGADVLKLEWFTIKG